MTLSGLQIFKLLPGGKKEKETNCKKCGFPTCMAFAMKLAKGQATIDMCPYISDELKSLLELQGGKSQAEITFGIDSSPIKLGGETVVYRHDKTFVNPTCLSVRIKTSDDFEKSVEKAEKVTNYLVDKIGQDVRLDSLTIENNDNSSEKFIELLKALNEKGITKKIALILVSENKDDLLKSIELLKLNQKAILYLKNSSNEETLDFIKQVENPIIIESDTIENLTDLSENCDKLKTDSVILNIPSNSRETILETLTLIRRSVIIDNNKLLRFPVVTFLSDYVQDDNPVTEGLIAGSFICRYSNLLVLDNFDPAVIYSLITLRQNLFTDPQKTLQVEPKLYSIGDVDEKSPLIVTTNFALTYFIVAGEIESSGVPAYLLITPSEGMSVLTAWAANKFNGEIISKSVKSSNVESMINHKNIILPGYVEVLKEELEEELPGWNVFISPKEAIDLPDYLRNL